MVRNMKNLNQNKIMNSLVFKFLVLIFTIFFFQPAWSQKKKTEVIRDTIWIMDGIEYNYNPLRAKTPEITKSSEIKLINFSLLSPMEKHNYFRNLVDSLGQTKRNEFNLDSLASKIIELDTIFNRNWCNSCVFETSIDNGIVDVIELELVRKTETYYYNQWGSFNWGYGPRWGRMHRGLDLALNIGDTIVSSFNGIVRYAQFNDGGYGNCVVVRHFNGIETLYGHMNEIIVKPGQLVYTKDPLGLGGSTGRSTGPHLHFETRYQGYSFDPLKIFNKEKFTLHSGNLQLSSKDITDPIIPNEVSRKKFHVVKSGETLFQIAKKHKRTVDQILKLNGIKNKNKIYVGQRIRVK